MLPRILAGLRILIGVFFLAVGIQKLMSPEFLYGGLLLDMTKHGTPFGFYESWVIGRYVEYHQTFFAYAIAISETLLGLCFLTGTLVSLSALGGAFLLLNFTFAIGSGKPLAWVLHLLLAAVLLTLGRMGAGLRWGGDAWLVRRIDERIVLFPLRFSLPAFARTEAPAPKD